MSSDQNNQNGNKRDAEKKRARRTRKHQDGRDYVCACGKSYLSYPALYTHIKTKHEGKAPQKAADQQERVPQKQDLQQLKMFLSKYYPQRYRGTPLNQLSQQFSEQQRSYIMPLLQQCESDEKNGIQRKSIISARKIFGKFIYDMNKRVNASCIKFLVKLIIQLHNGVCIQKKNENYCDQCTASMVPSVFNQLILNNHIKIDKQASQKIMQDNQAVCKVLVHFCNWLFNQKYTNYSIKYRF